MNDGTECRLAAGRDCRGQRRCFAGICLGPAGHRECRIRWKAICLAGAIDADAGTSSCSIRGHRRTENRSDRAADYDRHDDLLKIEHDALPGFFLSSGSRAAVFRIQSPKGQNKCPPYGGSKFIFKIQLVNLKPAQDTEALRPDYRLRPRFRRQLDENPLHVSLDRFGGHSERSSDLLVGLSFRNEFDNGPFALGENGFRLLGARVTAGSPA